MLAAQEPTIFLFTILDRNKRPTHLYAKLRLTAFEATRFSGVVIFLWIFALKWEKKVHIDDGTKEKSCFWMLACILSKLPLWASAHWALAIRKNALFLAWGALTIANSPQPHGNSVQLNLYLKIGGEEKKQRGIRKEIYFCTQWKALLLMELVPFNRRWLFKNVSVAPFSFKCALLSVTNLNITWIFISHFFFSASQWFGCRLTWFQWVL